MEGVLCVCDVLVVLVDDGTGRDDGGVGGRGMAVAEQADDLEDVATVGVLVLAIRGGTARQCLCDGLWEGLRDLFW